MSPHATAGASADEHLSPEQEDVHEHAHEHGGVGHTPPTGLRGLLHGLFSPHSHDPAHSIDNALEGSERGIRAVKVSLVGLGLTAVFQLAIVAISGSVALLADTVHNFSDALTAIPLWIAFALTGRVPSKQYTYGFGRAEDLAGLFIVGMIALSAVVAFIESIRRLIHPAALEHVWWVALAGLIGFAGNELVAIYRIRVGRQIGSAALVADGLHARTDGLTSLAVLVGALGVAAGFPLADPLVGLVITVAILVLLRSALRDVFRRLMDGVDPELVHRAEHTLAVVPGVLAVRTVRLRWIGHTLRAEVKLDVDASLSFAQAHRVAQAGEDALSRALPQLADAVVRADPHPLGQEQDHEQERGHDPRGHR